MALTEAIRIAKEHNLDLVQVTDKVAPPVCKITDYGKYLYQIQKKEKTLKQKGGETKGIRLTFGISDHDLETKVRLTEKFLRKGDRARIEMVLRGRELALQGFAKEKIHKFLEALNKLIPIKVERELKKEFKRLTMIISRK